MIVSDHGTELTSRAALTQAKENKIDWHFVSLGSLCRMASAKALIDECVMNC
jgi:hypothetical protein